QFWRVSSSPRILGQRSYDPPVVPRIEGSGGDPLSCTVFETAAPLLRSGCHILLSNRAQLQLWRYRQSLPVCARRNDIEPRHHETALVDAAKALGRLWPKGTQPSTQAKAL